MADLPIQVVPGGTGNGEGGARPRTTLPRWVPSSLGQGQSDPPFPDCLPCPHLPWTELQPASSRQASSGKGGSKELTGTHAGCAAAPGRANPGAGPRLASQGPGARPHLAGCSVSGTQSRRRPGSEVPGRGQPPALGPWIPAVSVGRTQWQ